MVENILGPIRDKHKQEKKSVYENQWRFRSTRGIVHNTFFYFNTGSLDENKITRQFLNVLTSYESMGACSSGIVSDGEVPGGRNSFVAWLATMTYQRIG